MLADTQAIKTVAIDVFELLDVHPWARPERLLSQLLEMRIHPLVLVIAEVQHSGLVAASRAFRPDFVERVRFRLPLAEVIETLFGELDSVVEKLICNS